jgi:hypothetical protein
LIAGAVDYIARSGQDLMSRLLAQAEEDARKHKLPVAKQKGLETDLFDPIRQQIQKLANTTGDDLLAANNQRFGTSIARKKDGDGDSDGDGDGDGDGDSDEDDG